MSAGIEALVGGALLVLGQRLFWLFVAGVGFVTGLSVASRVAFGQPEALTLILALGLAVLGALLALFVQKAAVAIVGFFAGGWLALWLLRALIGGAGNLQWAAFIVGGIIGIVLLTTVFEWGLVLLSALVGAGLLSDALTRLWPSLTAPASLAVFLLLVGVGVLIQARSLLR